MVPTADLPRDLGQEIAHGSHCDPVQQGPVDSVTHHTERRPVGARHRQHGDLLTGAVEPQIGVEDREERAADAGRLPTDGQACGFLARGQVAHLHADQLGQAFHADPRQPRAFTVVGVPGRAEQNATAGQPRDPVEDYVKRHIQAHLTTDKHP